MELSDQDLEAVGWLGARGHGARLAWGTHHLSLAEPFTRGWVDVGVPALMEAVGWSWVWTVEDPADPEPGTDVFSFPLPYDAALEMRMAPDQQRGAPRQVRLVCEDGRALPLDWMLDEKRTDEWWSVAQQTEPGETVSGKRCRPVARRETRADGDWIVSPVWTPAAISRGIEGWVREHVGRDDLRFFWDPQLPGNPVVERIAALLRESGEREARTQAAGVPWPVVELLVADDPDIREGW